MPRLATVKVKTDHKRGYKIINASAFDPDQHEVFEEAKAKKAAAPVPQNTQPTDTTDAPPAVEHIYTDEQIADLSWQQLRSAAAKVSESKIDTKDDAIEALKAHREKNAPADQASGD